MHWSKVEINHIRVSLGRCNSQQLANELGRAKENVEKKIREIDAKRRLAKLTQYYRRIREIRE